MNAMTGTIFVSMRPLRQGATRFHEKFTATVDKNILEVKLSYAATTDCKVYTIFIQDLTAVYSVAYGDETLGYFSLIQFRIINTDSTRLLDRNIYSLRNWILQFESCLINYRQIS